MNYKGQGAIEYLLLLAAAVVVVAVVISFMISTVEPVTGAGGKQTYDYICKQLDTNDLVCGCYLKTSTKGELLNTGAYQPATKAYCNEGLPEGQNTDPLLDWD